MFTVGDECAGQEKTAQVLKATKTRLEALKTAPPSTPLAELNFGSPRASAVTPLSNSDEKPSCSSNSSSSLSAFFITVTSVWRECSWLPSCPTVVAIDCTDAMSTCSCATTSASIGDCGGCRVSNRCDLGEKCLSQVLIWFSWSSRQRLRRDEPLRQLNSWLVCGALGPSLSPMWRPRQDEPEERRQTWLVCGALGTSPIHSHSAGRPADLTVPDFAVAAEQWPRVTHCCWTPPERHGPSSVPLKPLSQNGYRIIFTLLPGLHPREDGAEFFGFSGVAEDGPSRAVGFQKRFLNSVHCAASKNRG